MKALELLKQDRIEKITRDSDKSIIKQYEDAIEELETWITNYKHLVEYYRFAKNNIETYRCKCGSLGRVGYLCSNKECNKY